MTPPGFAAATSPTPVEKLALLGRVVPEPACNPTGEPIVARKAAAIDLARGCREEEKERSDSSQLVVGSMLKPVVVLQCITHS